MSPDLTEELLNEILSDYAVDHLEIRCLSLD